MPKYRQPGALRWRVSVEQQEASRDLNGQENLGPWTSIGTYWMEVRTLYGLEAVNAHQIKAETDHCFTCRYIPSAIPGLPLFNPTYRLNYKGRRFHIAWIDNVDERNRQLRIYCREVTTVS